MEFRGTACKWRLEDGSLIEEPVTFCVGDAGEPPTEPGGNPWLLRERFLALRSKRDLLPFLSENGRFCVRSGKRYWTASKIFEWQRIMQRMMKESALHWAQATQFASEDNRALLSLYRNVRVRFLTGKGALIHCSDILGAMLATIYVDQLMGARSIKACARPDCHKPFQVKSSHGQLYCTWECAHVVAVRSSRARMAARRKRLSPKATTASR